MQKILCTFLLSVLTLSAAAQNPYEDYKRSWKGKELPEIELSTLDEELITKEMMKGKVVLLNFWFISCPGCKVEYPGLQKLKEQFKKSGGGNVHFNRK